MGSGGGLLCKKHGPYFTRCNGCEMEKFQEKHDTLLKKLEWVTCVKCPHADTCDFAFDQYNTNGDCLAQK
jgi:hypothetical protein